MNTQLLIDAVVRQSTILIAQLATANGARTPVADVANQVFADLTRELHRQGVSRKVAADMFGLALRTYRRKIQRLSESRTVAGRSLWEAVHELIASKPETARAEVLRRFDRDDEEVVRGVLADLVEGGLVRRTGSGARSSYRAATPDTRGPDADSVDTLVWAIVYRTGPVREADLAGLVGLPSRDLDAALGRLTQQGRVRESGGVYRADACVIPLGQAAGWEAAVFDHFQAVVTTICKKLAKGSGAAAGDPVGGSTYSFEVWPGHPLEQEVRGQLEALRERLTELRKRVAEHNRTHAMPARRRRVVVYAGQSEEDLDAPKD